MPPENKVTAAKVWSDPTAKILDDLLAWVTAYENQGVGEPGAIRMKLKTLRLLCTNQQIVSLSVGPATQSSRTRITLAEVGDVLNAEGLPPVQLLPDTSFYNENATGGPVNQKVVPDNLVLLTPASLSDLGFTALGVSVTALELVNSNVSELTFGGAAGLVGIVEKVGPPYRQYTFVDATALPVLTQPRRLFIANV